MIESLSKKSRSGLEAEMKENLTFEQRLLYLLVYVVPLSGADPFWAGARAVLTSEILVYPQSFSTAIPTIFW